ncbi:cation:proton antiporter [Peptostreptococcus faecalis]|uniref:cation:proton antiporter n=1 Tax=Peptostreptococcus faecalis TaxID=2045015 RepID=UPI002E8E1FAD|nr:cation:proton antiporter [Peptostreptococcus faecalis]
MALIFIFGMILERFFKEIKLPALLGTIIAGILLGPHVLNLIDTKILDISPDLRQIALIVILMRAGLSLNLKELKKVGRPAILMCFVPACFEILAVSIIAPKILGITVIEAAILGCVVAAVSPAVIVPSMIKLIYSRYGVDKSIPQIVMAGSSVDGIFIIVLFGVFMSLAGGESISIIQIISIPISVCVGATIGILTGWSLSKIMKKIDIRDTAKVLAILSISFLFIALENKVKNIIPFSGLLAVMTMGMGLLYFSPEIAKNMSLKFSKIWVVAEILLFVLVGASVDLSYILSSGSTIIILIIIAVVFRMLGVFISLLKTDLNIKEKFFCMVSYTPKATVQAAIGGIPLARGIASGNMIMAASVVSILVMAPIGEIGIKALYKKCLKKS